jgi:hypothetical protein
MGTPQICPWSWLIAWPTVQSPGEYAFLYYHCQTCWNPESQISQLFSCYTTQEEYKAVWASERCHLITTFIFLIILEHQGFEWNRFSWDLSPCFAHCHFYLFVLLFICDCRRSLISCYKESTLIRLDPNSQLTEFVLVMNWKEICRNDCPVWGTMVRDAISPCLVEKENITWCRKKTSRSIAYLISVAIVMHVAP